MNTSLHDRIAGSLLGVCIGDALGIAGEGCKPPRITQMYGGRPTQYQATGPDHKWLPNWPAGKGTDDTQLTAAITRAFIATGGQFDMDTQVAEHVRAYHTSKAGWGKTTQAALANLAAGKPWWQSAPQGEQYGTGNGVAMKMAPMAAWFATERAPHDPYFNQCVYDLAAMTHANPVAAVSGVTLAYGIRRCLCSYTPFSAAQFMLSVAWGPAKYFPPQEQWTLELHYLLDRLERLAVDAKEVLQASDAHIAERYGSGSYAAAESLPFSLAYFLRKPTSIEALYDVIAAGGDTDTNGSMVGALLGALNGSAIFPQHLVDGLVDGPELRRLINQFCRCLGVA